MDTQHFPIPSELEIQECLLRFLFRPGEPFLVRAIELAYLDMCRAMRGISKDDPNAQLRHRAVNILQDRINDMAAHLFCGRILAQGIAA